MRRLPPTNRIIEDLAPFVEFPRIIVWPNDVSSIPEEWQNLLHRQSSGEVTPWVSLWHEYEALLPSLLTFLRTKVLGVAVLLEAREPPAMIYIYQAPGKYRFYRGGMPLGNDVPSKLHTIWPKLPLEFRRLYTFHNGWVYLPSQALGPLPVEEIEPLSSYDWGLTADEEEELPARLEECVQVCINGGGDSLCLNTGTAENPNAVKALMWWKEYPTDPDTEIDFWEALNAWMEIGFEDAL